MIPAVRNEVDREIEHAEWKVKELREQLLHWLRATVDTPTVREVGASAIRRELRKVAKPLVLAGRGW